MAEVRCTTHGVFDYKTSLCPGCLADARRRYEQLVVQIEGDFASARQTPRLVKKDAAPPPVSAGALAALRHEFPTEAEAVLAELAREQGAHAARQHEHEQISAALAALTQAHGKPHRLGSPASTYKGRLLGAVDVAAKRYARLQQGFLDGGEIICVPWIDAFAERVGQEIVVQWVDKNSDGPFHVTDRDG